MCQGLGWGGGSRVPLRSCGAARCGEKRAWDKPEEAGVRHPVCGPTRCEHPPVRLSESFMFPLLPLSAVNHQLIVCLKCSVIRGRCSNSGMGTHQPALLSAEPTCLHFTLPM